MKHCSKCKRCGEGSNRNRRGTAAVEFAVIAPVMLMLVFGMFEFGRAIMVLDLLNDVARQGARTGAVAGRANTDINTAVDTALSNTTLPARGSTGTTVTISVNGNTSKDASTAMSNDQIAVKVAVTVSMITWLPEEWFLDPTTRLSGTVVMRRE
jgi:Flp pilus assembly protein TadG